MKGFSSAGCGGRAECRRSSRREGRRAPSRQEGGSPKRARGERPGGRRDRQGPRSHPPGSVASPRKAEATRGPNRRACPGKDRAPEWVAAGRACSPGRFPDRDRRDESSTGAGPARNSSRSRASRKGRTGAPASSSRARALPPSRASGTSPPQSEACRFDPSTRDEQRAPSFTIISPEGLEKATPFPHCRPRNGQAVCSAGPSGPSARIRRPMSRSRLTCCTRRGTLSRAMMNMSR